LAIIDYGMMTSVNDQQKLALIQMITHMIVKDFDKLAEDMANLEFLPKDANYSDYTPELAKVFEHAIQGGGLKSVDFDVIINDLAELSQKMPFKIPPYMSLVLRSLSVLQGIALTGDEDFSIV